MKKMISLFLMGFFLFSGVGSLGLAQAQDDDKNLLAYNDEVEGEITQSDFEDVWFFEGEADDVVVIEMKFVVTDTLDPYLYLTTTDNKILAQNDDSGSRDSRIIYRLPETDRYQIVATRLGERSGSSSGPYRLSLWQAQVSGTETVIEGITNDRNFTPIHVFIPPEDGVYLIEYAHIRGDYYPNLIIQSIASEESSYYDEVGGMWAVKMLNATLSMEMSLERIYIFALNENYYNYETQSREALYTIKISPLSSEEPAE
jgi:hypothetical protein